jgi:hypothetical protein
MSDSSPSSWKELYLEALLESDEERLTELVQTTEQAIALRAQQLTNPSDHQKERREMAGANAALLSVKTNKLGWPPVSASDACRDFHPRSVQRACR